jgi:hypothetical protein
MSCNLSRAQNSSHEDPSVTARLRVQLDNANVPQPRMDEGSWLQDGTTFRQRTNKECLVQHAFRRSLDDSLRTRKLNRTLSTQVDVPRVDAAGVEP